MKRTSKRPYSQLINLGVSEDKLQPKWLPSTLLKLESIEGLCAAIVTLKNYSLIKSMDQAFDIAVILHRYYSNSYNLLSTGQFNENIASILEKFVPKGPLVMSSIDNTESQTQALLNPTDTTAYEILSNSKVGRDKLVNENLSDREFNAICSQESSLLDSPILVGNTLEIKNLRGLGIKAQNIDSLDEQELTYLSYGSYLISAINNYNIDTYEVDDINLAFEDVKSLFHKITLETFIDFCNNYELIEEHGLERVLDEYLALQEELCEEPIRYIYDSNDLLEEVKEVLGRTMESSGSDSES